MGKNEALPGAVPIESYSYTSSDDCRDDEAITAVSVGDTSRVSSCDIDIPPTKDDDLFGFKASWERHFHESQIKIDDHITVVRKKKSPMKTTPQVVTKKKSPMKTTPQSKSKNKNQQSKSRFDKWSKGLKKSNPYKYQSISNGLFVGTGNDDVFQLKKSRASLAHSSLESKKEEDVFTTTLTLIDDRDEFNMSNNRSEMNTRDQRQHIEEISTYDIRSILDNEMFQTNNNDSDHSHRSIESTANEPLLHSNGTILRQDITSQNNNSSSPTDFEASSSCDIQLPQYVSLAVEKDVVLNKMAICNPIVEILSNNNNINNDSSSDEESLPPPPPPPSEEDILGLDSDDDDSAYVIENVDRRPLLMKAGSSVDCNRCGRTSRKNILPKKKKADGKKKKTEDKFQFYWKYESMKNSEKNMSDSLIARRSEKRKEELDELDHIISKIDPPENALFRMPIGIQLSTITEHDEDLDPSLRSLQRTVITTLASGSIQQDGVVTLNSIGNLLPTSKESVESRSEVLYTDSPDFDPMQHINMKHKENVDTCAQQQQQQQQQQEALGFDKDFSVQKEVKINSQIFKQSKKEKRGVILRNNEVVIPVGMSGDDSSATSRAISDITEDYLQIPFSSPLYRKVLMAFQEARKETEAEAEQIKFRKLFKNNQSAKNIQSEIEEDNSNEELNHLTTVALYSESNSTDELNHLATVAF